MVEAWMDEVPAQLTVLNRFVVEGDDESTFAVAAGAVADVLAASEGCVEASVQRSIDQPAHWTFTTRWLSVGHYRRAISPVDVRAQCVPFFLAAIDEPSAYEVLYERRGGQVVSSASALMADVDRATKPFDEVR